MNKQSDTKPYGNKIKNKFQAFFYKNKYSNVKTGHNHPHHGNENSENRNNGIGNENGVNDNFNDIFNQSNNNFFYKKKHSVQSQINNNKNTDTNKKIGNNDTNNYETNTNVMGYNDELYQYDKKKERNRTNEMAKYCLDFNNNDNKTSIEHISNSKIIQNNNHSRVVVTNSNTKAGYNNNNNVSQRNELKNNNYDEYFNYMHEPTNNQNVTDNGDTSGNRSYENYVNYNTSKNVNKFFDINDNSTCINISGQKKINYYNTINDSIDGPNRNLVNRSAVLYADINDKLVSTNSGENNSKNNHKNLQTNDKKNGMLHIVNDNARQGNEQTTGNRCLTNHLNNRRSKNGVTTNVHENYRQSEIECNLDNINNVDEDTLNSVKGRRLHNDRSISGCSSHNSVYNLKNANPNNAYKTNSLTKEDPNNVRRKNDSSYNFDDINSSKILNNQNGNAYNIAYMFIYQYYYVLHTKKEMMYNFYSENAILLLSYNNKNIEEDDEEDETRNSKQNHSSGNRKIDNNTFFKLDDINIEGSQKNENMIKLKNRQMISEYYKYIDVNECIVHIKSIEVINLHDEIYMYIYGKINKSKTSKVYHFFVQNIHLHKYNAYQYYVDVDFIHYYNTYAYTLDDTFLEWNADPQLATYDDTNNEDKRNKAKGRHPINGTPIHLSKEDSLNNQTKQSYNKGIRDPLLFQGVEKNEQGKEYGTGNYYENCEEDAEHNNNSSASTSIPDDQRKLFTENNINKNIEKEGKKNSNNTCLVTVQQSGDDVLLTNETKYASNQCLINAKDKNNANQNLRSYSSEIAQEPDAKNNTKQVNTTNPIVSGNKLENNKKTQKSEQKVWNVEKGTNELPKMENILKEEEKKKNEKKKGKNNKVDPNSWVFRVMKNNQPDATSNNNDSNDKAVNNKENEAGKSKGKKNTENNKHGEYNNIVTDNSGSDANLSASEEDEKDVNNEINVVDKKIIIHNIHKSMDKKKINDCIVDRLKDYNDGHAVQIDIYQRSAKKMFPNTYNYQNNYDKLSEYSYAIAELDCRQSQQILLDVGLYCNGIKLNIEHFREKKKTDIKRFSKRFSNFNTNLDINKGKDYKFKGMHYRASMTTPIPKSTPFKGKRENIFVK
ncbi:conserved Plasmodium protein, unknown function [Plasmodium vinckei vinckei]|uniref:NTF2 domain-containing protein n=1 Tax=Plasmodium vinckei vinckei TaxID=54757 RepID=A0A449BU11_PLAVN|nr:conserved Plasmodium protein, unknown function [Plasmodium vinckei vinckei]VEV56903.1 conserved Plasmodium protein, unknown function [Plasmodium vinckei vinckei]